MKPVSFRILGPLEIEAGGEAFPVPRGRERCLLGVLLLEANNVVPIDLLADLVWGDDRPMRVRNSLQGCVSRVRAVLADVTGGQGAEVVYHRDGYRLAVDEDAVDVHRFRVLLSRAARSTEPSERISMLSAALDEWRGPPLVDAVSSQARERLCRDLEEQRLSAVEDLALVCAGLGRERDILPVLAGEAGAHPGRETLVALYIQALYRAGRRSDALDAYMRTQSYLADELGLDPGPELRRLHQAILRGELATPVAGTSAVSNVSPNLAAARRVIPRQLPADIPGFSGRTGYLEQLDWLLPTGAKVAASVVISAIGGTAGVGKTALAVHWAHRVADRFPDGQLYINLRGFDPGGSPMEPADALRALLDGLDVPSGRIPVGLDAQVGLYRSLLAGRRMLVLLDNARDAGQVRPLLPGTAGCLAVVTSRNQLSGLAASGNAKMLTLNLLTASEARQLLRRRLGDNRVAAEPDAVEEIVGRCVGLPLALAVVAAHAAANPGVSLRAFADELGNLQADLAALADPDVAVDVQAVFSWSIEALEADVARLFRLLGLHPGPYVTSAAAASLAGVSPADGRRLLAELARASLVAQHARGRYAIHDLLRAYAISLTRMHDGEDERRDALRRLFDYLLLSAHAADKLSFPHRDPVPMSAEPTAAVDAEHFGDPEAALSWLTSERHVLVAAVESMAATGFDAHAWDLAWALVGVLRRRGRWREQTSLQRIALAAATRLADPAMQVRSLRCLASDMIRLGRLDNAHAYAQQAIDLHSQFTDRTSEGHTYYTIADLYDEQGDHVRAIAHAHRALRLFEVADYVNGQADTLNLIGHVENAAGNHRDAVVWSRKALVLARKIGSQAVEAAALDTLALAYHHLGRTGQAIECYELSARLQRALHNVYGEAEVQDHLGDSYQALGDQAAALTAWRKAVALFDQLEHPAAAEIRAKIGRSAVSGGAE